MDEIQFINRLIVSGINITKDDLNDAKIILEEAGPKTAKHLLMIPLYYKWSSFIIRKFYRLRLYNSYYPEFRLMDGIEQNKRGVTVFEHSLRVLNEIDKNFEQIGLDDLLVLRLAAIFHDVGKISTMETLDGKVRFLGHEYDSVSTTSQLVDKYDLLPRTARGLLLNIIQNHMAPLQYQRCPDWSIAAIKNFIHKCFSNKYDLVIRFAEYDKRSNTKREDYIQPLYDLLNKCNEVENGQ